MRCSSLARMRRVAALLALTACGGSAPTSETGNSPTTAPLDGGRRLVLLAADPAASRTLSGAVAPPDVADSERQREARRSMVAVQIEGRGVKDPLVLDAMRRVPRHLFVAPDDADRAYGDFPIPIGHGQTISQPYIVGLMTELLAVGPQSRVLEIGTGSGYQAAILAEIVAQVDTIEIVEPLARQAAERLRRLGYRNINVAWGDGYFGWPEHAPYDAIIVTAAATHVPPPLLAQLKSGGRMAIPVGPVGWTQNLLLIEKQPDGSVRTRSVLPVAFVPLTRGSAR